MALPERQGSVRVSLPDGAGLLGFGSGMGGDTGSGGEGGGEEDSEGTGAPAGRMRMSAQFQNSAGGQPQGSGMDRWLAGTQRSVSNPGVSTSTRVHRQWRLLTNALPPMPSCSILRTPAAVHTQATSCHAHAAIFRLQLTLRVGAPCAAHAQLGAAPLCRLAGRVAAVP